MVTNFKLFERKQVGVIYHFTTYYGIKNILEQDSIISATKYISLTRTKHPYNIYGREDREIRIVLDGDKLSNNYKIEPYNFFQYDYSKKFIDKNKIPINDETEERIVLSPKHKIKVYLDGLTLTYFSLKNIKKYIIRIDILKKCEEYAVFRILKENYTDIEINFVRKW